MASAGLYASLHLIPHNHTNISPIIPYLLPPSIMIHDILPVQFTCLTVFFHNLPQVVFGLPLGVAHSTSYSIHFFIQSFSSFHSTCLYHHNLFCCSTEIMSSKPSLSLNHYLLYRLLNSDNLYKQMTSSLCTCYSLYHISCVPTSDN